LLSSFLPLFIFLCTPIFTAAWFVNSFSLHSTLLYRVRIIRFINTVIYAVIPTVDSCRCTGAKTGKME
jgi:hypothetical protein